MRSTFEPSTRSPISTIPYDILREIFTHCLPQYPLKKQQPNTMLAPMLLCRICSSWRTIALASHSLWSHLSFCLTVFAGNMLRDLPSIFVAREIEFVQWWRKNQGSIAPFLSLSTTYKTPDASQRLVEDTEGVMGDLVDYLMSVQYLQLDSFLWSRIQERCTRETFGSIQSLVYSHIPALISPDAFPALRHLSLSGYFLRLDHISADTPLTHISLHGIRISLSLWFAFICALPNLQCGYFDIKEQHDPEGYTKPLACTLPRLSTLYLAFDTADDNVAEFKFDVLFTTLHLPSVHTLALSWLKSEAQSNHNVTVALYTTLKSTPAIKTLVLAENFLGLIYPGSSSAHEAANVYPEPIWYYTPHLEELQLEVPQRGYCNQSKMFVEAGLHIFVWDIMFTKGSWLDLRDPACPIQVVTIVDRLLPWVKNSNYGPGPDSIGQFMMRGIRRNVNKPPNITFQIASKSESDMIADEC